MKAFDLTEKEKSKMRKILTITCLVFLGAAVPWGAGAIDCQYHNFKIDLASYAPIERIDPYDDCWEFTKVVGTLGGRYVSCTLEAESPRTSFDIWGDEWGQIQAWKYYSFFETHNGVLELREWSWFDTAFGNETGLSRIIGGTEAFEDAFGTISYRPQYPNNFDLFRLEGYICTP